MKRTISVKLIPLVALQIQTSLRVLRRLCVGWPGVLMAGRLMVTILSGVHLGTENLHFEWKGNSLAFSGKVQGQGVIQAAESHGVTSLRWGISAGCAGRLVGRCQTASGGGETAGRVDLLRVGGAARK